MAAINLFGIWFVYSGWRAGRGSPQFVLALLPLNLMFLAVPVPLIIQQIIRGFRNVAAVGSGSELPATLAASERAFLLGSGGFLVALVASAALQWHAGMVEPQADGNREQSPAAGAQSGSWQALVLQSSAVIAPVTVLASGVVAALPRTIIERTTATIQTATANGADVQQLSIKISSWLILSFIGGAAWAVGLATVSLLTLILVRSNRFAGRMTTFAWIVLVIVAGLGAWNVARIVGDWNWLATHSVR